MKQQSKYLSIQQPPLHASKLGRGEYIFIIVLHDNGFECAWAEEEQRLQGGTGLTWGSGGDAPACLRHWGRGSSTSMCSMGGPTQGPAWDWLLLMQCHRLLCAEMSAPPVCRAAAGKWGCVLISRPQSIYFNSFSFFLSF